MTGRLSEEAVSPIMLPIRRAIFSEETSSLLLHEVSQVQSLECSIVYINPKLNEFGQPRTYSEFTM